MTKRSLGLFLSGLVVMMSSLGQGCAKNEEGKPVSKANPLPKEENARARKACQGYIERVCGCAANDPSFTTECALAKATPAALEMNISLASAGGLTPAETEAVRSEARKIAAGCFEAIAKLPASCAAR